MSPTTDPTTPRTSASWKFSSTRRAVSLGEPFLSVPSFWPASADVPKYSVPPETSLIFDAADALASSPRWARSGAEVASFLCAGTLTCHLSAVFAFSVLAELAQPAKNRTTAQHPAPVARPLFMKLFIRFALPCFHHIDF